MIAEAFIVAALALPATVHFARVDSVTAKQFMIEYRELKKFLDGSFPGQEFIVMPRRQPHAVPGGYERLPFLWRDHVIYQKITEQAA